MIFCYISAIVVYPTSSMFTNGVIFTAPMADGVDFYCYTKRCAKL